MTLFTQAQSQRLPMTLRPYQTQAVDAVYEHLRMRDDNPCVVIPTGGGKTPVIARICSDAVTRWNGRVLTWPMSRNCLSRPKTNSTRSARTFTWAFILRDSNAVTRRTR